MDQQSSAPTMPASGQGTPQKSNRLVSALVGIVVAVIAGAYIMRQKKQSPSSTMENSTDSTKTMPEAGSPSDNRPIPTAPEANMPAPNEPSAGTPPASEMAVSEYKDGTYTAVGNYVSPGGPEEVGVSVTLKGDIIVDSSITVMAQRPISKDKQVIFSENYKQLVVGKNIDEVNVTKVSSSSLTPKGFMDALDKIEVDAKL